MKRLFFFLAIATLIGMSACHPDPVLSVSPDSLDFTEAGGSQAVQISANYPWTASVSGTGFSVSPTSGEGSGTVTVTAEPASSTDAVSGTLSVRSEGLSASVSLSQAAKPTLILGDGMKVPAEGGTVKLPIQYNTDYTVEVEASAQSWIRFIRTKSLSSGKLELEIAANEGDERSGKVTVKDVSGKVAPVTATITQAAEAKVLWVGDAAVVPAAGGPCEVEVRYNVDYTVEIEESAQSWLHYVETRTVRNGTLVFNVEKNEGRQRSGKVTLKDNSGKTSSVTVTIVQKAEDKVLTVGGAETVSADGGTLEVEVRYNVDYVVDVERSAQSWIHYIETRTVQSGTLVFKIDPNEGDERTGVITVRDVSGEVDPVRISVTQKAEDKVLIVGEAETVPFGGGRLTVPVQHNCYYWVEVEESAKSWIHCLMTRSVTDGGIDLSVDANHGAERSGKITVKESSGTFDPIELTITQEASPEPEYRRILMEFYNAMDGPNWVDNTNWGSSDVELYEWKGVGYSYQTGEVSLRFYGNGLKGEIPESFGGLETMSVFRLIDEPGVTGTLPDSFRKLTDLEWLDIENTSMTSPPDFFGGMTKLRDVEFFNNPEMTGLLPESLGSSDNLQSLLIWWNSFTGTPPASWARHYKYMSLWSNHLTGKIPETYLTGERVGEKLMTILMQQEGYGFEISDLEIPGYWPDELIEDIVTGETFTFDDVVFKNKYTVWLSWAPWCPFSSALLPQLLDYYRQYRQDGLEIIATVIIDPDGNDWTDHEGQLKTVMERGYDTWYNYYFTDHRPRSYPASTPQAEVYDSKGNIVFSYSNYPVVDSRKRFGHPASTDLIAFLETVIGPAEVPDPYTSTDYSKDGEVLTLQKATVGKGIDIVFMGDAYTDRDMGTGGLYETVMRQAMDEFFAIEPYKTFRNRFNVYAVKVVSPNGRIGEGYTTALGSTFGNGTEIGGFVDKCYEYALKVPGINDRRDLLVNVIANTRRHSGTAMISESTMSAVTFTSSYGNDPEYMGNVLRHEAGGHGFGFLADEYTKYQAFVPQAQIESWNRLYEEYGIYSNIDFTDDPAKVRWSAFLADDRYKDEVGIYEGGGLYSLGAYRPSKNSMMNENFEYYNAPSRWTIYQRIMERSGEEYSFEKFLEYDAVNRGKAAAAARPPLKAAGRNFEPTTPPVILP